MKESEGKDSRNTLIGTDISYASELIRQGELVAIPTETVYGLAANALDEQAVRKIFAAKGRPLTNPLIIHVAEIDQVSDYAQQIPAAAYRLLEAFSPGPLTVLLPRRTIVPDVVTAHLPHVAIRIPNHPLTHSLLSVLRLPLAAPSANPYGYISPTSAQHVYKMLKGKISYILDGGNCAGGIESTIVGFPEGIPTLYREGLINKEAIEAIIGPVKRKETNQPLAPGMTASHYSPRTPLILSEDIDELLADHEGKHIGLITYDAYSKKLPQQNQLLLYQDNDLSAAASRLYAAMHEMDERGYDLILVRKLPHQSLGVALNDRLNRASHK
jgi:L-threonylcarbamoyladenylate synthase